MKTKKERIFEEVENLKGRKISLLDMDKAFSEIEEGSIFDYDSNYWDSWKADGKSAFSYGSFNIWFEILEDKGISEDTTVKVIEVEEI